MDIDTVLNNSFVKWAGLISLILWALGLPFQVYKRVKQTKEILAKDRAKQIVRDVIIHLGFALFGLIIPLVFIIFSWNYPGWLWTTIQILSWYAIFSYAGFILMIWKVLKMLRRENL